MTFSLTNKREPHVHTDFQTLVVPDPEADNARDIYVRSLEALNKLYSPKVQVEYERFDFREGTQLHDESLDHFVTQLKKLAASCYNPEKMLGDTGAPVNIIGENAFYTLHPKPTLQPSDTTLYPYGKDRLPVALLGMFTGTLSSNYTQDDTCVYVTKGKEI